jgi:hypothetical protein
MEQTESRKPSNAIPLGAIHHGSYTFWVVMTAIGLVEMIIVGALAYRARRAGRDDRYQRYRRGVWGFSAWTGLCVARVILLKG